MLGLGEYVLSKEFKDVHSLPQDEMYLIATRSLDEIVKEGISLERTNEPTTINQYGMSESTKIIVMLVHILL